MRNEKIIMGFKGKKKKNGGEKNLWRLFLRLILQSIAILAEIISAIRTLFIPKSDFVALFANLHRGLLLFF